MPGIHALIQTLIDLPREEWDPTTMRAVSAMASAMADSAELRAENARLRESFAYMVRPYEKG